MRRMFILVATTVVLVLVGAGAALAAVSGSLNQSTDGSYTSSGTYNFKYAGCKWATNAWDGYIAGNFVVTTPNDHLNGKVDGYGWTKIQQGNSAKSYPYSSCLIARDVTIHDSIAIQVCREHWYGDDCASKTANR